MADRDVFEFDHYRNYLDHLLSGKGQRSGHKAALAKYLKCDNSFVSKILGGKSELSLEQAMDVATFFRLSEHETKYFLLLVQYCRAGSKQLRQFFSRQMTALKLETLDVKNYVLQSDELPVDVQNEYYSSWDYAAIHVLVSIAEVKKDEDIAKYLNLPLERVVKTVRFLLAHNLISQSRLGYTTGTFRIHLNRESPHIKMHHCNWRLKALSSLDLQSEADAHYSAVFALSKSDQVLIKQKLLTFLKELVEQISRSHEEELCCLNLDYFGLRGGHLRS